MTTVTIDTIKQDVRIIGLISIAHGFSHFFQLVLPPLFPFLKTEFNVSYAALGLMATGFYVTSGIAQTAAGFLVDRIGARKVLITGLAIFSIAIALAGLAPSFIWLIPIMILAGIGNSVFHPADFAILNASISNGRLGRAYSAHGIFGNLGWTLAPITSYALSIQFGWRNAVIIMGCSGLVMLVILLTQNEHLIDHRQNTKTNPDNPSPVSLNTRVLLQLPVLMCFGYFAFLSMSLIGLQSFAVTTIEQLYSAPHVTAAAALTGFLVGSTVGVLIGGIIADRTLRHDRVALGGVLLAAAFVALIASGLPGISSLVIVFALAGLCLGSTTPSRDLLVRAATPLGSSGKVYGFVYSGLDLGAAITPTIFGFFLDHNQPQAVFIAIVAIMLTSLLTVIQMGRAAAQRATA